MYEFALKDLEIISQAVGNSPEYVQGGGGNTSVKINDELMAVKASGYKLSQITQSDGFVVVNYKNIVNYFKNVNLASDIDFEKDSVELVKKNIVALDGLKVLRPSIEAGFHSILKKYVIHTHPVYANIICCSAEGCELVDRIFTGKPFNYLWIPYIKPGFNLTLKIMEEINKTLKTGRQFPAVIFMENHGLIATSDNEEDCIKLHNEVNRTIIEYLKINEDYPDVSVKRVDETTFASSTPYILDYFNNIGVTPDFFCKVLYPDQLVYLNGSITENKIDFNSAAGKILYNTNYSVALTIEETLTAFLYIIENVKKSGLTLKTMPSDEINFIRNWEGEKYRKSLMNNLKQI